MPIQYQYLCVSFGFRLDFLEFARIDVRAVEKVFISIVFKWSKADILNRNRMRIECSSDRLGFVISGVQSNISTYKK